MAVADYNFDVPLLIESVKNRPCLWDKTDPAFKDRYERHRSWLEICEILKGDDFDNLNSEEQKQMNDAVTKKWNHVRDAFSKSVKRRQSNPALKEYIYHRRLQFLIMDDSSDDPPDISDFVAVSVKDEDDTLPRTPDMSRSPAPNGALDDDDNDTKRDIDLSLTTERVEPPSKVRKLYECRTPNSSGPSAKSTPDEDEAFYISISPLVRRMNENEKLEFKIGVLNLIKNIRQKH